MSLRDRTEKLRRIKLLLDYRLMETYPTSTGTPTLSGMVFFGEIPDELLATRQAAMEGDESFREWILVSEELLGSEWLAELDNDYGVSVIFVDDLNAIRAALLRPQSFGAATPLSNGDLAAHGDLWLPTLIKPSVVHLGWPCLQTDETSLAQAQTVLRQPL
jgi:hypothetical protein